MPAGGQLSVLATRGEWGLLDAPGDWPQRRKAEAIGRWSERVPALCVGAGQPRV